MNKAILSLLGCSSSIAGVLASGTIASPDTAKTIPYPEVMNLNQVPIFDARGMVPQTAIAKHNLPRRSARPPAMAKAQPIPIPVDRVVAKANPAPITVDLVSQAVREVAITRHHPDRLGDRHFAPTSMMVLGYSSPSGTISQQPRTVMY